MYLLVFLLLNSLIFTRRQLEKCIEIALHLQDSYLLDSGPSSPLYVWVGSQANENAVMNGIKRGKVIIIVRFYCNAGYKIPCIHVIFQHIFAFFSFRFNYYGTLGPQYTFLNNEIKT